METHAFDIRGIFFRSYVSPNDPLDANESSILSQNNVSENLLPRDSNLQKNFSIWLNSSRKAEDTFSKDIPDTSIPRPEAKLSWPGIYLLRMVCN